MDDHYGYHRAFASARGEHYFDSKQDFYMSLPNTIDLIDRDRNDYTTGLRTSITIPKSKSSLGVSFVKGLRVLAKNNYDGLFYFGKIVGGGDGDKFEVCLEDASDPTDIVATQLTSLKNIVSYDDAFQHDINKGDHVLLPLNPSFKSGCFIPGIVIDGAELRNSLEGSSKGHIVVKTVDNQIITAKPQTAVWVAENRFGIDGTHPTSGAEPISKSLSFDDVILTSPRHTSYSVPSGSKDELKQRIDKQIYETEKLLHELKIRKVGSYPTLTQGHQMITESHPVVTERHPVLIPSSPRKAWLSSRVRKDDVDWDSGVASDHDEDKVHKTYRQPKGFKRGRVVYSAPVSMSFMKQYTPQENKEPESIKKKRSQYLLPEKYNDSVKAVPARTEWVAKWEKRDQIQKEAEENAEKEKADRLAKAEEEVVQLTKQLKKQEKKEEKERKERKRRKEMEKKAKEEKEIAIKNAREEWEREKEREHPKKIKKYSKKVHLNVAKKAPLVYKASDVHFDGRNSQYTSGMLKSKRPHLPAKEYHSADGTPIPRSQDRRFLTSGDINWSPEKVSEEKEVTFNIITHRPMAKIRPNTGRNTKFYGDSGARELETNGDNNNNGGRSMNKISGETGYTTDQHKRTAREKREVKLKEAEEKAQNWKYTRLEAMRQRRQDMLAQHKDEQAEKQLEKEIQLEHLAKLELQKSKIIAEKVEREIDDQERRLQALRRLHQKQLEKEDNRTKRAFNSVNLNKHVDDQKLHHYRASILP